MKMLGVSITTSDGHAIIRTVREFLDEEGFHRIATVNPEFLVLAEKNFAFKHSLQSADLCIADGAGIVWAGWMQGKKVTRFPGADLLHEIFLLAERDGHTVFLAIKKNGLSSYEEIRTALLKEYPNLSVGGADIATESLESYQLPAASFQLLLCNFGAPNQELFLESIRNNPGDVRLAMGVGGAFDFLTGKQKRAPKCLRAVGLEWLWRLILQPKRWKRIWSAVLVFPWLWFTSCWRKEKKLS